MFGSFAEDGSLGTDVHVPVVTGSLDFTSDWMAHALAESSLLNRRPPASAERQSAEAFVDCTCLVQTGARPTT